MKALNPSLNFQVENVSALPIIDNFSEILKDKINSIVKSCVSLSRNDWDSFETSWDFQLFPLLNAKYKFFSIKQSFKNWKKGGKNKLWKIW